METKKPTPIAVTKFDARLVNPNALPTARDTKYETRVCTMKMTGMTASSTSFSAVNCDANFVKTISR